MWLCCVFAGELCIVVFVMFLMMVLIVIVLCAIFLYACFTNSVSLMIAVASVGVEVGGALGYPLRILVDKYFSRYVPCHDSGRFSMLPIGRGLMVNVRNEELQIITWGYSVVKNCTVAVLRLVVICTPGSCKCCLCVYLKRRLKKLSCLHW